MGLDISTHCIGVTVAANVGAEIKVIEVTHFRLRDAPRCKGMKSLLEKSLYFKGVLGGYVSLSRFGIADTISKVVIEEPLISSNNSKTASVLLRFNGMISLAVYETLGVIPEFISSYDARKFAFPDLLSVRGYDKEGNEYSINRIKKNLETEKLVLFGAYPWECDKKYILWNKIIELYPGIHWIYGKNGELCKENFDASDSMVCVIGYVKMNVLGKDTKAHIIESNVEKTIEGSRITYTIEFGGERFAKKMLIKEKVPSVN